MTDFLNEQEVIKEIQNEIISKCKRLGEELQDSCSIDEPLNPAGIKLQREVYLMIIQHLNGKELIKYLVDQVCKESRDFHDIYLTVFMEVDTPCKLRHRSLYREKIINPDNNSFSIGRKEFCDMAVDESFLMISRYHVTLIPIKLEGKLFLSIVDIGSRDGVIHCTSDFGKIKVQTPGKPELIPVGVNTYLILSGMRVTISTSFEKVEVKECIICMTKPRNIVFNCEHFICCIDCANKCEFCPTCRSDIISKKFFTPLHENENVSMQRKDNEAKVIIPQNENEEKVITIPIEDV